MSIKSIAVAGLSCLLMACASDLPRTAATLLPAEASALMPAQLTFTSAVTVSPPSMYQRDVRAGSVWRLTGRLEQGAVYRPVDTVFMLESAHVHEAYLVIDGRTLVGAYLPVERAFVKVKPVPALPIQ